LTAASAPELDASQSAGALPELARVHWRPRVSEQHLTRVARLWTATTVVHTVPFIAGAVVLVALLPLLAPVGIALLLHAWAIPELYAARGAGALRAPRPVRSGASVDAAERVAVGLLGDLVDHRARELHARSGVVLERGRLGVWLLNHAGALLVRPGGRRVNCYCVRVPDASLPPSDRTAHLLLALRSDEIGFATVANHVFSGALWRVRRRLPQETRPALDLVARKR
jgi:hypothetical protein